MYCLTTMNVMLNNFQDMTSYNLVDSRESLVETFFFICTVEEHLP